MRFIKRLFIGLFILAALLVAGAYAALQFLDVENLQQLAITKVGEQTGRTLTIDGGVSLKLGPKLNVVIENVSLTNPKWAANDHLISAKSITLAANLMPLLKKQLQISQITLDGAVINLESSKKGSKSWEFSEKTIEKSTKDATEGTETETKSGTKLDLSIDTITLTDSKLSYKDHKSGAAHKVAIADLNIADIKDMMFRSARLNGQYNGANIKADIKPNGEVLNLNATMSGNGATIKTSGTIAIADQSFELSLNANAPQFKQLMALAGQKNDDPSAISVTSNISGTADVISFTNMQATYGNMNIDGSGKLNLSKTTPYLSGKLNIPSYSIDKAAKAAPTKPANQDAAPNTPAPVAAPKTAETILPVDALKTVNADVALTIGSFKLDKIKLDNIKTNIALNEGVLNLKAISFDTPHGQITGNAKIIANTEIPSVSINANTGGLTLASLMKELTDQTQISGGQMKADIDLGGTGKTVQAIQRNLSGEIDIYVDDASYDIPKNAKTAAQFFDVVTTDDNDSTVKIDCMVTKMTFVNGVATPEILAMKTPTAIVTGKGTLDLSKNRMDMVFKAQGSNIINLSDITPPIRVSGPFNNLSYIPDPAGAFIGLGKLFLGATTGVGLVAVLGEKVTNELGITAEDDPCLKSMSEELVKKQEAKPEKPKEVYKKLEDDFRVKRDVIKQDSKKEIKRIENDVKNIRDGFLGILGKD